MPSLRVNKTDISLHTYNKFIPLTPRPLTPPTNPDSRIIILKLLLCILFISCFGAGIVAVLAYIAADHHTFWESSYLWIVADVVFWLFAAISVMIVYLILETRIIHTFGIYRYIFQYIVLCCSLISLGITVTLAIVHNDGDLPSILQGNASKKMRTHVGTIFAKHFQTI